MLGDQSTVNTITFSKTSSIEGKVYRIVGEPSDRFVVVESPVTTNEDGHIKVGVCYSEDSEFISLDLLRIESSDPCEGGGGRHGPDAIFANRYIRLIFDLPGGNVDAGELEIAFQGAGTVSYNFVPAQEGRTVDFSELTRKITLNGESVVTLNGEVAEFHWADITGGSPYIALSPELWMQPDEG